MRPAILCPARRAAGSLADGTVSILGKDVDLPLVIVGSIVAFILVDRVVNR